MRRECCAENTDLPSSAGQCSRRVAHNIIHYTTTGLRFIITSLNATAEATVTITTGVVHSCA